MSYDLKLERLFDATVDEVFDAFIDPKAHEKCFRAGQPEWFVFSEVDLKPGGRWDLAYGPEKERLYRSVSIFAEIDRPHRLVFRMTRMWPGTTSFDTDLVVAFQKRGNKTLFTMNESGFPTEEARDGFGGGWPDFIDALGRVVGERQRDKRRSSAA
jgi:uncharacterized protein YndB with AHSA1/START domain